MPFARTVAVNETYQNVPRRALRTPPFRLSIACCIFLQHDQHMSIDLRNHFPLFEKGHFRPLFVLPRQEAIHYNSSLFHLLGKSNIFLGFLMALGKRSPHLHPDIDFIEYEGTPSGCFSLVIHDAWEVKGTGLRPKPHETAAMMEVEVFCEVMNVGKGTVTAMIRWVEGADCWPGARLAYEVADDNWTDESMSLVPGTPQSCAWLSAYLDGLRDGVPVPYIGFRTDMVCSLPARVMEERLGGDQYIKFRTSDDVLDAFAGPVAAFLQWEELMMELQRRP